MSDTTLSKLRDILLSEFTEAELAELCRQIGLHYDALSGTGRFGKTREIIEAARAQGKLRLLQIKLREMRPVAYAAIDLPQPEVPIQRQPKASNKRSPAPSIAVALVVVAGALLLISALAPRQAAPSSAGEAPALSQAPTEPALAQPTDEVTPEPTPEPSPTPASALPVVVVQPSPTAEPSPPVPVNEPPASPSPTDTPAHPAIQTVLDANVELVALFTGRKDASALQPLWMPSTIDSLVSFATTRLPRAMRVSADQREVIQVSYDYLRPPTVVDEQGNAAIVTSREYWRFSTTVNNVVICETRDYTYNLVIDGTEYRIRAYTSRLLSTRCR